MTTHPATIAARTSAALLNASEQCVTAREWFASGSRRPYDLVATTMVQIAAGERLGIRGGHRTAVHDPTRSR
jgi:hypothetical protein